MCTCPLEAWTKAAGTGTSPTSWCSMMSDVLFLVVPKKELEKVIALPGEESLTKVRDEIQVISCSSEVVCVAVPGGMENHGSRTDWQHD